MSVDSLKEQYFPKYITSGKDGFYKFLLICQIKKLVLINKGSYKGISPDLEYLDHHDRFLVLYRREGEEQYLDMAKIFRKVAHKIHRIMLKKNMTIQNNKFLNLV